MRPSTIVLCLAIWIMTLGCSDSNVVEQMTAAGEVPETVEISSGTLTAGFSASTLRWRAEMPGYRITKRPITQAQFGACVAAGVCEASDPKDHCSGKARGEVAHYSFDDKDAPAICVSPADAAAYCAWVGGKLPTLADWMYASRGAEPQRYSWGRGRATCERHPRAERDEQSDAAGGLPIPTPPTASRRRPCAQTEEERTLRVGKYADGASPFGVEDVLLTPGELIRPDDDNRLPPCRAQFPGCLVTGIDVGAIDSVVVMPTPTPASPDFPTESAGRSAGSAKVYGFRCVMRES